MGSPRHEDINSTLTDSFFHNSFACLCSQAHLTGSEMPLIFSSESTFSGQLQRKGEFSIMKGHFHHKYMVDSLGIIPSVDLSKGKRYVFSAPVTVCLYVQVVTDPFATLIADEELFDCI